MSVLSDAELTYPAHGKLGQLAAKGDGTVMSWDWQVRPRDWMRMLGPLVGALGGPPMRPGRVFAGESGCPALSWGEVAGGVVRARPLWPL